VSKCVFLLKVYALALISNALVAQTFSGSQHSHWPMTVGSRWIYQSESSDSSRNGMVTVMEVLPSPSVFGCLSSGTSASSPFQVAIYKIDPRAYWDINRSRRLRWMVGVHPSGYTPTSQAGSLFALGWYITGLDETPETGSTINLRSTTPSSNLPYLLLRAGGGTSMENVYHNVYQHSGSAPNYGCASGSALFQANWSVTYTPNQYYSTPGFSGFMLKAQYHETNPVPNQPPQTEQYIEDWYFAQSIGPVVIHTHKQQGIVPEQVSWQRIKLVSYQAGSGAPGPAGVTLRDALIARAGTTSGLNFYQWGYYFERTTNLTGLPPNYACVSSPTSPMTVDAYLSALETVGTSSCTALTYSNLSNGANPNTALQSMISQSGASRLRWDQWNYYLTNVTGIVGQAPENVCMQTVSVDSTNYVPNRYLLLTPRQWLLYYQHYYMPSVITCWS